MEVTKPIFQVCGTPTYVAPEILVEGGGNGYGLEESDIFILISFEIDKRSILTRSRVPLFSRFIAIYE